MTWKIMEKVLVVGAGLTGATSASLLRERFPGLGIVIWDKANGVGGRMSTSRSPTDSKCTVDLGLQYVSVNPFYRQKHNRIYEELLSTGLLSPLITPIEGDRSTDCTHYVTPQGSSSIVKHFIEKSGVEVKRSHHVCSVDIDKGGNPGLTVTTLSGVTANFDAIVLTLPVPQVLQLKGSIRTIIESSPEKRQKLEAVKYSSRFCLGLFYKAGVTFDVPWSAKYISDHPCLRYVCIDSKKRGAGRENAPSVVVHTSVPYGVENVERDKDEVKPEIYQHFKKMFPNFPEPDFIKGHKWRYSQVSESYEGSPGCLVLKDDPFVICGGDGFTHSKLDGCMDSAQAIVNTFHEHMANTNNDS